MSLDTDKAKDTNAEALTIGKRTLRRIFWYVRGSRENSASAEKIICMEKLEPYLCTWPGKRLWVLDILDINIY